ncbi:MAG: UDP-N-acetylmuramoyl-L-alanyl-D-glutamate--2,6-diaminopimelate ligase, partial [Bacilli bacterium]
MNIKTDSRKVKNGDTFIAIKGLTVDGHDYIKDAIKNGATKIICEHGSYDVETINVNDTKKYLQEYLVNNYQDVVNELDLIGITGTNGKTTTSFLVYQMLNQLNIKTAYIGTIGFYIEDKIIELSNTTPEILDIYTMLLDAKEKGCKVVVMEVSSHALELKRVEGLNFTIEAFTNLTEDHLDFHKTMQNYLNSKILILNQLKDAGKIIINNDDKYGKYFKLDNKYKTIGFNISDYQILKYKSFLTGTKIYFNYKNKNYEVETNLKGKFNVYNYITALAIIREYNVALKDIINISKFIYPPKGRCEIINIKDSLAIIDYAHTPDAVEKIISTFSEDKKGKIIVIIGCGGDRDPLKRPIMGKIASDKADYVIFTNDNPRTEDENKIIKDILQGVEKDNYEVIFDRKEAINKGLNLLNKNDILLILGKGHEDYQIIGHTKYHLDDKEIVLEY